MQLYTCHQRPPVLRDHIFMANKEVFQASAVWVMVYVTIYMVAYHFAVNPYYMSASVY